LEIENGNANVLAGWLVGWSRGSWKLEVIVSLPEQLPAFDEIQHASPLNLT
jgi:hypothetical protein